VTGGAPLDYWTIPFAPERRWPRPTGTRSVPGHEAVRRGSSRTPARLLSAAVSTRYHAATAVRFARAGHVWSACRGRARSILQPGGAALDHTKSFPDAGRRARR
jgi:hypothetical protein